MSEYVELEPTFDHSDGTITNAGDEVFVRGIGGKILGIGTFAGSLVLAGADGTRFQRPVLEIQGELVSGARVDLWSTDPVFIDQHRGSVVFPIAVYLAEARAAEARIVHMMDSALAHELGVTLE